MASNSILISGDTTSTFGEKDRPVIHVDETSLTDSPGPSDVPATPALLLTPPTPGPRGRFPVSQIRDSETSQFPLTTDLNDISDTSTVCDHAIDTSQARRAEENNEDAPPVESLSKQGKYPPPNVAPHATRKRQGTVASAHSKAVSSISFSYVTENGPGDKEGSPDHDAAKAWSNGARAMMELDEANIQRWKEEIDTLLVFSGIFSAVVTGVLIEAMRLLRPEPSANTDAILERISAQLRNPQDTPDQILEPFVPKRHIVQVNSLWFTSLILSLGVAFIGILVKQWLGEYSSGLMSVSRSRISKKHARARQHRHAAFERWRVHAIITALPFFLLTSLVLFCSGLALLLFTMNLEVATVAICMISFIFIFSVSTTILPSIWDACPYRSPQAYLVFVIGRAMVYVCRSLARGVSALVSPVLDTQTGHGELTGLNMSPTTSVGSSANDLPKRGLWARFREWAKRTGRHRTYWSWQEREEAALLSSRDSYQMALLDELDSVKMDVAVLQDVIRPCLLTLPLDEAILCFRNILNRRAEVLVQGLPKWESDLDRETCRALVNILLDMLSRPELSLDNIQTPAVRKSLLQKHEKVLGMFYRLVRSSHHRLFLGGIYDRIFSTLLAYIKEPQWQYTFEGAAIWSLVIVTLATLQDKIPSNAVTKEDVVTVSRYVCSAEDDIVVLRASALVFAMILALPSPEDSTSEDLSDVARSIITAVQRTLLVEPPPNRVSGEHLMRVLPSLHVYLSSLEALLSTRPKFLTDDAWEKLESIASHLAMNFQRIHRCVYTDSNGRTTRAYLDSISTGRKVSGIDVPSPGGVPRRQTLTLIAPIEEPVDSTQPPPKAQFHWPSWPSWPSWLNLNFGSVRGEVQSGEDIPLDHVA